MAVGDLDGDGLDDVLDASDSLVEAVRGFDGETLWMQAFSGSSRPLGFGDLDGAGGADLVAIETRSETVGPGISRSAVVLRALRGADGAQLWDRTIEATSVSPEVGLGGAFIGGATPLAPSSLAELLNDFDGNGVPDLLIRTERSVLAAAPAAPLTVEVPTFEVLSGESGASIASFTPAGVNGFTAALVVPDLTGDSLPDIALLEGSRTPPSEDLDLEITAYPGTGGDAMWTRSLSLGAEPLVSAHRLNGDEYGDVLVQVASTPPSIQAISGADGAHLWTRSFASPSLALPAGDANLDGGEDLIVSTGGIPPPAPASSGFGTPRLTLQSAESPKLLMISGGNGDVLWERSSGMAEWMLLGDATGDGVADLLESDLMSRTLVVSGGDGATVAWERATQGIVFYRPLGDLDADGRPDVLEFRFGESGFMAVSGRSGDDLWDQNAMPPGSLVAVTEANLRGDREDLLETISAEDGSIVTQARSGADGALLWQRI